MRPSQAEGSARSERRKQHKRTGPILTTQYTNEAVKSVEPNESVKSVEANEAVKSGNPTNL
jgi:hypothetical protein